MALIIIGAVLMGLSQMTQGKAGDKANKQAYDTIVPEIVEQYFYKHTNGSATSSSGCKRYEYSAAQS